MATGDSLLVDGKFVEPTIKGKYKLQRDMYPKHIVIRQEGYEDEHITILQSRKNFWGLAGASVLLVAPLPTSIIPVSISLSTFAVGTLAIVGVTADRFNWAYSYPRKITIPTLDQRIKIVRGDNDLKDLVAKDITFDPFRVAITEYPDYRNYRRDSEFSKKVIIANRYFEEFDLKGSVNRKLFKNGYIDSNHIDLENSYIRNNYLSAVIQKYDITYVVCALSNRLKKGGIISAKIGVLWKLEDYYGNILDSTYIENYSGEFPYTDITDSNLVHPSAVVLESAIHRSLAKYLNRDTLSELFNDTSAIQAQISEEQTQKDVPKEFIESIVIPKPD
ncbi:MAG: hypothetical protein MK212_07835, partial [Saprospiraceae bacterium]|nr:hypothetical protein [Saprospiraceae bacterium]